MQARPGTTLLFVLLFLGVALPGFGQHIISGKVTSAEAAPVANAVIIVSSSADSSIIKTAISDTNGLYSVTLPGSEGVSISVDAAGYETQVQTRASLGDANITINFSLSPKSNQLSGVTVTTGKPLLERRADRMIFNVPSSIAAIGSNALEAIKKAPGVVVRQQDNTIALAGKGSVLVLIDDRLMQLTGEDLFAYLQAIPSENIERIEVITTPPARYDAAGNSGLINIVLKKNRKMGMNGEVRAGYEQSGYGTATGGGNVNYRKGPLNVYANASYSDGAKKIVERLNTDFASQSYLLSDPYKRDTKTLQYTVGADYQLHKTGLLGVQATGSMFDRLYTENNSDIIIVDRAAGAVDSIVHTSALATMKNHSNILNANYVWSIDTVGKKLTLNANRLWFDSKRNRDYDTQSLRGWDNFPISDLSRNKNTGTQTIDITTAQADLELPYSWASVSVGGRLSYIRNRSRNNFLHYLNDEFIDDPSVSNEFHYTERVQAGYASANKAIGKWEVQAGLRGEHTQTEGYSVRLGQTNTRRYFNLFPTAYLQYTASDNHIFNANYSKRIDRPGYRALDPYRSYSSPYSYIEGNPFLKPAILHIAELGYTFKSRHSLSAFYQFMPGTFGQVFFADTANKTTYVRSENYGDYTYYGLNASTSFSPVSAWEVQATASASVQQVRADYPGVLISVKPVSTLWVTANNSFTLNKAKTLLAQVNAFYITSYMNDLMRRQPQLNLDAGLKALFLEKNLVVSLSVNDILRTLTVKGVNQVTGQQLDSYFDERNVRMTLSYRFGNSKLKAQRQRNTGIEEERRRT